MRLSLAKALAYTEAEGLQAKYSARPMMVCGAHMIAKRGGNNGYVYSQTKKKVDSAATRKSFTNENVSGEYAERIVIDSRGMREGRDTTNTFILS